MKKTLLFITLITASIIHYGQLNKIHDGTVFHNDSSRFCMQILLEANEKEVIKSWSKFLNKEYKIKLAKLNNEYSAKAISSPNLSERKIDLYTSVKKEDTLTLMKVYVAYGYDIYLNKDNPGDYGRLSNLFNSWSSQYIIEYYKELTKPLEKKLAKIAKEEVKLERQKSKLEIGIAKNLKSIAKNTIKVEKANDKITALQKSIEESEADNAEKTEENAKTEKTLVQVEEKIAVNGESKSILEKRIESINNKK